MVYILNGKVSCLRLMATIWTASSDAARQACGKAAARWGSAQAVTFYRPISKSRTGGDEMETESQGWGGRRRRARAGRRAAEAACEAADGDARRQRRARWYGEGPTPCGSATTPRSIAAAEKGQPVSPGTGVRRSATRSAGGRGGGGEPSGATSVRRGQGGANLHSAKRRSRLSQGKSDTGGAEHTRGKRPCPNVRQQRRVPGKEVGNGWEPATR